VEKLPDPTSDGRLIAGYSLAYAGIVGSVASVIALLWPKGLEEVSWKVWIAATVVLVWALGVSLTLLLKSRQSLRASIHEISSPTVGQDLYKAIPAVLRDALDRSDYKEVIRLGDALSRPLFESGEFAVRLDVGRMTEEAAAHLGVKEVQYRTLIDAIGWSLIELGDFAEAEASIQHGLELAQAAQDHFYLAKAYRHLGAIARRRGNLDAAADAYRQASEAASHIVDSSEAKAMQAGIMYAAAHLRYTRRDYDGALESVDQTVDLFAELNDVYRQDMALVLKADIQVGKDLPGAAADTYRQVIQSSRANRESVHYVRAVLGLAELHLQQRHPEDAKRLLARLDSSHVHQMPAFSPRFDSAVEAAAKLAGNNPHAGV
jgi:tetratricopeptide (TPR) repeat protein